MFHELGVIEEDTPEAQPRIHSYNITATRLTKSKELNCNKTLQNTRLNCCMTHQQNCHKTEHADTTVLSAGCIAAISSFFSLYFTIMCTTRVRE